MTFAGAAAATNDLKALPGLQHAVINPSLVPHAGRARHGGGLGPVADRCRALRHTLRDTPARRTCALRIPRDGLRANLEANARVTATTLTTAQASLTRQVARELMDLGARFAAIDLVGGQLLEVNVGNPGGLATLEALYGKDFSPEVARCIAGPQN